MKITDAMITAVSALVAYARDVGVTADNVANFRTPEFRAVGVRFPSVNAGLEPSGVAAVIHRATAVSA